jgi:translation initiation factor 6
LTVSRISILGSPNIGVYALATNRFVLVPPGTADSKIRRLEKTLSAPVTRVTVGDTALLGALASANSSGIVLPSIATDEEVKLLSRIATRAARLESRRTALGNLILANDRGAIVSDILYRESEAVRVIRDTLDVEVAPGRIADLTYIGSLAVANNKVALAHPMLAESERELISDVLKVSIDVGTVNGGCPFVGSGILVNDFGVAIGSLTAGPELMIISTLFGA